MFPLRPLSYIWRFKNLFIEPISTISLSESTFGPPDPYTILPSDENNGTSIWCEQNKTKKLSKVGISQTKFSSLFLQ